MAIVLKTKNKELECTCPGCGSFIGFTADDLYMGYDGKGFECPGCGEFITIEKIAQNKWPDAFYEFSTNKNAVHVGDESVQKYINQCIDRLATHDDDYYYIGTGDTFILATWEDKDTINITVCQGYHEASVDKDWYLKKRY